MKKNVFLICLLSLSLLLSTAFGEALPVSGQTVTMPRTTYEKFQEEAFVLEMMDLIQNEFVDDVSRKDLMEAATAGMLESLEDPYTFFYEPEQFAQMWEDDEGAYGGLGILINTNYKTDKSTVIRIFTGSPAEQAGVQRGDIIYKVEDLLVNASNINDAVSIMRGEPGTDVHVIFLRDGEEVPLTMTRAIVNQTRVEWTMIDGDIGYICVYEFAGDCSEKFRAAMEELKAKNARGYILDLRDNPGGWTQDAEIMADVFLDGGLIYTVQYRDGTREESKAKSGCLDVPLVILVNENSASSSEILSGALQDRIGAVIVGVKTFGKGIIQGVVPIGQEGAGMQLTVAQYFTPNGHAVHGIGITPDVVVELPEEHDGLYNFADLKDPQLKKAVDIMQEKLAGAGK